MTIIEIILIGVGLSMDACCVSVSNGMSHHPNKLFYMLGGSILFGIFQGLMPIIGYFSGSLIANFLNQYSYWIVFVIFFILGGKMLLELWFQPPTHTPPSLTGKLLITQAIATSIDALAVGIGFQAMNINIYIAGMIIAIITFVLTLITFYVGYTLGSKLNKTADLIGGLLLLFIAFKTLLNGLAIL